MTISDGVCASSDRGWHDQIFMDFAGQFKVNKYFCICGRIIDLDADSLELKKNLGKSPECPFCRNQRIASEMDELDAAFYGLDADSESI